MAQQITSDIATEVDITARKSDSFYLKLTLTKEDGSVYDFSAYELAEMTIKNSSGSELRIFTTAGSGSLPTVHSTINVNNANLGILIIDVAGGNMSIPQSIYSYKLTITDTTPVVNQKITLMYGKFKVTD
jgi:hypothetical protein